MASITSELQTIRSGIFGKDVRAAIADGLEKVNTNGGSGGSGQDGKGIQSITRYYYRTTSSTKPTSTAGFTTTYTAPTTSYRFSWAYDHFTYTDGTTYNTGIFQLGVYGQTGASGTNGTNGEDGGYYTPSVSSAGLLSWTASKTGMTSIASVNIKGDTGPAPTLSIGTVSTLAAGSNATAEITGSSGSYSLSLGIPKGQDGTSGSGGSGGPGIESITQMYLRTTSTSVTTSTSGWGTTPGTLTSGQWLWTYFKINLDDGTEVSSAPICIGNYNARMSTVSLYQLRNSSTSTPSTTASGWTTSNQEPTSTAPYVWGCLRFTYYPTGSSSSHTVYSNVFRLKTYQEPASSGESAGGMVLESNGCGGWQSGGMSVSGTDILSNVSKGVMPVMYISGFYAPVVCVESTTQDGMDAIRMWYYYGGCSTPTLANTTVVV